MKKLQFIIIVGVIIVSISSLRCSKDETPDTLTVLSEKQLSELILEHSMKGWELYSWQEGENWYYSFLMGTNRVKSLEEVKTNKIIVASTASLKLLLNKLPANEQIFWIGKGWLSQCWNNDCGNLSLPDDNIVMEIKNFCTEKNLILVVGN